MRVKGETDPDEDGAAVCTGELTMLASLTLVPSPKTDMNVGNEASSDWEPEVIGIIVSFAAKYCFFDDVNCPRTDVIGDPSKSTDQRQSVVSRSGLLLVMVKCKLLKRRMSV